MKKKIREEETGMRAQMTTIEFKVQYNFHSASVHRFHSSEEIQMLNG